MIAYNPKSVFIYASINLCFNLTQKREASTAPHTSVVQTLLMVSSDARLCLNIIEDPVVCVPSSFFIGENGIPLEVVAGSVSAEDLLKRITKVQQVRGVAKVAKYRKYTILVLVGTKTPIIIDKERSHILMFFSTMTCFLFRDVYGSLTPEFAFNGALIPRLGLFCQMHLEQISSGGAAMPVVPMETTMSACVVPEPILAPAAAEDPAASPPEAGRSTPLPSNATAAGPSEGQ